jgi:hypothetical protein
MSDLGEIDSLPVEANHGLPLQQLQHKQRTPQSQSAGLLDEELHSQLRGAAIPSPSGHAVMNHDQLLTGWQVNRFACVSPPA